MRKKKEKKNKRNTQDFIGVFCCVHLCCLVGLCDFCIVHSVDFLLDVAAVYQANSLTKASHHPPPPDKQTNKQTIENPGTIAAAARKDKSITGDHDEIVLFSVLCWNNTYQVSGLIKATESSDCTSKLFFQSQFATQTTSLFGDIRLFIQSWSCSHFLTKNIVTINHIGNFFPECLNFSEILDFDS